MRLGWHSGSTGQCGGMARNGGLTLSMLLHRSGWERTEIGAAPRIGIAAELPWRMCLKESA